MDLVAFFLPLLMVLGVAAAVLLFVAYPHRGRLPRHARWAVAAVGRVARPVQVHDDVRTQALLSDRGADDDMAERLRRVERVVTVGIAGRPGS